MNLKNKVGCALVGAWLMVANVGVAALPPCESDQISRNGWKTYWNPKRVVSVSESGPIKEEMAPDFVFSDLTRDELLTLTLFVEDKPVTKGVVSLGLMDIPVIFSTQTDQYEESSYRSETKGYVRLPINGGEPVPAQIQVKLKKSNSPGYTLPVMDSDGVALSITMGEIDSLFNGDGPLVVELWADGRRLLERWYHTNGAQAGFKKGIERYSIERVRKQVMRCRFSPSYAIN